MALRRNRERKHSAEDHTLKHSMCVVVSCKFVNGSLHHPFREDGWVLRLNAIRPSRRIVVRHQLTGKYRLTP